LLKKNNFAGNTITDEIFGWKSLFGIPGKEQSGFRVKPLALIQVVLVRMGFGKK
jgi:hypothetical protein